MKEKILLAIVAVVLSYSQIFAIEFGLGIRGGKDFYQISQLKTGFRLLDMTQASIAREGFSNPWAFGISLQFNLDRDWRFVLSGDAVLIKYNVLFTRNYPTIYDPFYIKSSEYKIDWGRASILGTLEKSWQITYRFSCFAGAGGGLYVLAPVVSDKFLFNTLLNKFMELDVSKDIDMSYKFGGSALLGVETKILNDSVSFLLEGRYNFMSAGKNEEPTRFITVLSGIVLNFKL